MADMLQTLIFECCNAINPKFKKINKESFSKADDFATAMEIAEHYSYQLAFQIYDYGIKNCRWPSPKDIDKFEKALSLETWLKKAKEKNNNYKNVACHFDIFY